MDRAAAVSDILPTIGAAAGLDWLAWGIGLIIGMPLLVIVLGETAERLESRGLGHYRKPLDLFRNSCLFLLFVTVLLRMVVGLPSTHLAVKLVDTLFWTSVLNAALALSNALVFGRGASSAQSKAPKLLLDLGRFFLVAIGAALIVSHVWQVNLTGLIAALGVSSLVIGLALQDTLSNVFSGVTMISAGQFRVGDWIRLGDLEGQVRSVSWRSVTIATTAGDLIVIPNNLIARDKLRIIGGDAGRTVVLTDVTVDQRHPPEQVRDALLEAAAASTGVLPEPKPVARVVSYAPLGVVYRVAFWVPAPTDVNPARGELLSNLWYVARRHGISLRNETAIAATRSGDGGAGPTLAERIAALAAFKSTPELIERLTAAGRLEGYRKGEVLITAGQRGKSAFLILSGTADAASGAADERPVHAFAAGDLVVFKSFLRNGPAPLQVRCASDCEVLRMPIAAFEAALKADAGLAHQVEQLLTAREEAEAKARPADPALAAAAGDGKDAKSDRVRILTDLFMS